MKMLAATLAILGSSAFATTNGYDLKLDLSFNGKHISSPRMTVKAGEVATITQKTETEESFIEVVATDEPIENHSGILMKFVVGVIGKNGMRTIKAKPQIVANESEPAQITIGEKNGDEVSLSVVANRTSL